MIYSFVVSSSSFAVPGNASRNDSIVMIDKYPCDSGYNWFVAFSPHWVTDSSSIMRVLDCSGCDITYYIFYDKFGSKNNFDVEATKLSVDCSESIIKEWSVSGSLDKNLPPISTYVASSYIVPDDMSWVCAFSNWWDLAFVFFKSKYDSEKFILCNSHINYYTGRIFSEGDALDMGSVIFPNYSVVIRDSTCLFELVI
jgi:hypothetical protein